MISARCVGPPEAFLLAGGAVPGDGGPGPGVDGGGWLGLGGRDVPAVAGGRQAGGAGAPGGAAAEQLAQRQRPAQVQVGVVLPGEADAAQHLDAVLRVVHRVVQRQRGGGRGRQRMLGGRLVGGAGGAPG